MTEHVCELDRHGRFISEEDIWHPELLILNAAEHPDSSDTLEIDDAEVRRKLLLLAAEVRRLRHKLGEYDLTQLQGDAMWGDSWAERDIARATLDPKFRIFLAAVDHLWAPGQPVDHDQLHCETGLSEEEIQLFSDRLVEARILKRSEPEPEFTSEDGGRPNPDSDVHAQF